MLCVFLHFSRSTNPLSCSKMFKINLLSCMKLISPKLGYLRVSSRCISACFAGVRPTRAVERLKTLNNNWTNQPNFTSNSARTLSTKTYGAKIKQRDKNVDCFNVLSSSKHLLRGTTCTHQTKTLRCFSFTSKDVLPDESALENYDFEDKNAVHKHTKKSKRIFGHHEYEFDANGYLSVDDVTKFLYQEAAYDICVIETSGAKRAYVDYFIVVSGVSNRHIRAMSKNLEHLFRGHNVRGISRHGHVTVEGLESDTNWLVVDIGNMVVHFFLPEVRQLYELEKLWTLGPKYDDQYKGMLEEEEFLHTVFLGEQTKNPDQEE